MMPRLTIQMFLVHVRYWDILIYNHLREKNIVIPQKHKIRKGRKI